MVLSPFENPNRGPDLKVGIQANCATGGGAIFDWTWRSWERVCVICSTMPSSISTEFLDRAVIYDVNEISLNGPDNPFSRPMISVSLIHDIMMSSWPTVHDLRTWNAKCSHSRRLLDSAKLNAKKYNFDDTCDDVTVAMLNNLPMRRTPRTTEVFVVQRGLGSSN